MATRVVSRLTCVRGVLSQVALRGAFPRSSRHLYHATSTLFNAETEVQPAKIEINPTLVATSARLGLRFSDPSLLLQAVTHKSFEQGAEPHNERLQYLGARVLELYVAEHLHSRFPNLPNDALENAIFTLIGRQSLTKFGEEVGLQHIIRWTRPEPSEPVKLIQPTVMAQAVRALIGAIYQDKGAIAARNFIRSYILSRELDITSLIEIKEPKRYLSTLMKRQNRQSPVSRILKETGRLSNSPVFIVGVFSGNEKIGEGYGSSIKMAEFRAAKDALLKHYMYESKDFMVPSDAEASPDTTYIPPQAGDTPPVV
ncbi:mitochondrial 54S ribosomal protein mL57 [Calcarisporiella thermophila]|uniref:mitochondrial 54S ribosomal protein mL57 n=1 Tax=Calcarisporiella thermophila TaxID=911321 RepID=UPI0037445F02